jgi:hypothetical protein
MSNDTSYKPSPVTHIDGIDIDEALLDFSSQFQDEDALYNSMFFNPAKVAFEGKGRYSLSDFSYHPDNTTYQFLNGSTMAIENTAETSISLEGVESGQDIFDIFLDSGSANGSDDSSASASSQGSETSAAPSSSTTATATPLPTELGYPSPVISDSKNTISGYFLKTAPDVAVLNVQTFEAATGDEFQSVVEKFLAQCRSTKKTRLIIDLRGNPGGIFYTGYDLFKQLFPSLQIISKTRFRSHPATNVIGSAVSQVSSITVPEAKELIGHLNLTTDEGCKKYLSDQAKSSVFNYRNNLIRPDGPTFSSWADLYGPQSMNGDNYTEYQSSSFSNSGLDLVYSNGLVVSGYGDKKHIAPQAFDNSNIVVVSIAL